MITHFCLLLANQCSKFSENFSSFLKYLPTEEWIDCLGIIMQDILSMKLLIKRENRGKPDDYNVKSAMTGFVATY